MSSISFHSWVRTVPRRLAPLPPIRCLQSPRPLWPVARAWAVAYRAESGFGEGQVVYELALHTYLAVGDVEAVSIRGLEGARFVDKVDGGKGKVASSELLRIAGETDRVFLDTTAACVVDAPVMARRPGVGNRGSHATVVRNPGRDRARAMRDIGEDGWGCLVFVETPNAGTPAMRLGPDAHRARC